MKDLELQRRLQRLQTEALYLAQRFGEVRYDLQDGTWLHIKRFPIGQGWNKSHVEILVDVPCGTPGYPQIPPTWFWTDRDLKTRDGRSVNHFFNSRLSHADSRYLEKGWGHFCIHVNSWQPSSSHTITRGDSFLTYLELIRVVFNDRQIL